MGLINYEAVNDRLNIVDVAEIYGVPVDNRNKSVCPFHGEKTASLSYKNNRFNCFGCGAHGDIVDFVSKLFHLSSADAVSRLNADFNLGINHMTPPNSAAINQRIKQKQLQEKFKAWELEAFKTMAEYSKLLRLWRTKYKPVDSEQKLDERFVQSLQKYDYTEYILNIYTFGSIAERVEFFSDAANRNRVTEIERTVRSYNESAG